MRSLHFLERGVNEIHRREMIEHPVITQMERFGYGPHPSRLRRATNELWYACHRQALDWKIRCALQHSQEKAWVRRKIGEYG